MEKAPEKFNPEKLHGISFFDVNTQRTMRYIYPDAGHWTAGWLVIKNPSGDWMTWRKPNDADIAAINQAVVCGHHGSGRVPTSPALQNIPIRSELGRKIQEQMFPRIEPKEKE